MAGKQQIMSVALVAVVAVIFLIGQVSAAEAEPKVFNVKMKDGVIKDPELEQYLKTMLETAQRVKEKAGMINSSEMVAECDRFFAVTVENLNKANDRLKAGISTQEGMNELENLVKEAADSYHKCDKLFADNLKPSPFTVYDAQLNKLAIRTEKQAENDAQAA